MRRMHVRGSKFTVFVTAVVAAAVLAACNDGASGSFSAPSGIPAVIGSTGPAPAVASQAASVTVPPVTVPPVTVPPVTVPPAGPVGPAPVSTSVAPMSSAVGSSTTTAPKPPPVVLPAASFSTVPKAGSTDLPPRTPITVRAAHGVLAGMVMTSATGTSVKGTLSADRTSWTVAEPLGYGATYTLGGRAMGVSGKSVPVSGTFSTLRPDDVVSASISPDDGDTVGIAAPILISLGTDIDDTAGRQNIEKAITVTTVPKTQGSFAWIKHDDGWGLDWRPKSYWAPGTKVTVTADLYGVSYGENLWGQKDITANFTIGRSEITKGDINSHRLKVYRDGKLLFDFPTSYGLESDPGRVTRGGTYIVMSKEYLHLMSNPAYHYFNFKAYYAVRISNNGTFIHANDGTADIQGYENETHGCANLTMTNAKLFYEQTMYGDPVEITGSSIPMSQSDGDVYDWSIPWSKWQTLSASSRAYVG